MFTRTHHTYPYPYRHRVPKGVITPFEKVLLPWKSLMKDVSTPVRKALFRLFKQHYYAFLKGIIKTFLKALFHLFYA